MVCASALPGSCCASHGKGPSRRAAARTLRLRSARPTAACMAQSASAASDPPLVFENNFFVSGDYAVGGVSLVGKASGGFATVGRVGRPHGLDGSFVVEDASEEPARFAVDALLWADARPARIVSSNGVSEAGQ